jgi:type IV pilus assembly protein PilA
MPKAKGFTLIELLIVVVILGILAAIAIPKFANTKEKAILASMKGDLRNLVTEQEGFWSDNFDYAGLYGPAQTNATGGVGQVQFAPSLGNLLTLTYVANNGWSATMANASLNGSITTCGIFIGSAPPPDPSVTTAGSPACY